MTPYWTALWARNGQPSTCGTRGHRPVAANPEPGSKRRSPLLGPPRASDE
ncbi:MAG: hypothetical protein AVDCRST_MAG90-738 [uncultured Microvirga sp.]|uniref:Uncharacterized protein n=1 Tax=uncultured Microvirga sp. TaxID=412392 RepID=A0A6J4KSA6_9HYPH|nr:MAG: hypothetical protein AVDCRST_MAG90-738 [uncultured Microvirga sp.]